MLCCGEQADDAVGSFWSQWAGCRPSDNARPTAATVRACVKLSCDVFDGEAGEGVVGGACVRTL